MYLRHFQLKEYPFSLTPDTDFYFDYAGHREALNVLLLALRTGEGFIKVTGECGLGKTLMCRGLLNMLDGQCATAYVPDPLMSPAGLRVALVEELGIRLPPRSNGHMALRAIRRKALELARENQRIVLLLDEAHQLPAKTMEAVRLLTNLETEKSKLLQVVMFGQPELDRRLRRRSMRQLLQRVSFSARLRPLTRRSTESYIAHRLRVAGCAHIFSASACADIHSASGGTPRVINVLCHKALMSAFGAGRARVTADDARRAILDTESARQPREARPGGARVLSRAVQLFAPQRRPELVR